VTTWRVPDAIEEALWQAARRRLPPELVGGAALTAAVVDRSRRYTSDRERLSAPAVPVADLAARALFFSVVDAPKIGLPLAELAGRGLAPTGAVRLLDLGAGCGAMTLGALDALASSGVVERVEAILVDRDRAALDIAADAAALVAAALGVACHVRTVVADVPSYAPSSPADLVVAGSVLNELPAAARLPLVERALAAVDRAGAVILVEPALRAVARDLHVLRDEVLTRGLAHVFAPCTRRGAPCPMLADERDWCHEERLLELSPRAARIAQATGLRDGAMKLAYLVLRHGAEPLAIDPALRVVSQPFKSKGKHELYACGDDGRLRLRLLHRSRSPANRPFERARRGDLLTLSTPSDPDLTPDTSVTVTTPSDRCLTPS